MTEKHIDVTERLQKIGETVSEFRDLITNDFKDMDVELKDWHFTVGKAEKEYIVETNVKLVIRPKKAEGSRSPYALMNEEETKGKIEKKGKITNDKSERSKSKAEKVKGKIQEEVGKAKRKV